MKMQILPRTALIISDFIMHHWEKWGQRSEVKVIVEGRHETSPLPLRPTKRRSLKRATWFFITPEAFRSSAE